MGLVESPLVETLAHGRWTPTALSDTDAASFHGASCLSARSCVAVLGNAVGSLNGGQWTISALPGPPDARLTSVSCPSTSDCTAVGNYLDATGVEHVAVETLASGTWTAQNVALTASPPLSSPAVSCTGTTCVAVSSDTAATSTRGRFLGGDGDTEHAGQPHAQSGLDLLPVSDRLRGRGHGLR